MGKIIVSDKHGLTGIYTPYPKKKIHQKTKWGFRKNIFLRSAFIALHDINPHLCHAYPRYKYLVHYNTVR